MSEVHPINALGVLDMLARTGMAESTVLDGLPLSRTQLLDGSWIAWSSYVALLERASLLVGGDDALTSLFLEYGKTQQDLRVAGRSFASVLDWYRFLVSDLLPGAWRCLDGEIEVVDDTHVVVSLQQRATTEPGCLTFYRVNVAALASFSTHLDLPACEVSAVLDARGGRYHVTLPTRVHAAVTPVPAQLQAQTQLAMARFVSMLATGRGDTRERARTDVIASVGRSLAEHGEVSPLADAIVDGMYARLELNGVQLTWHEGDVVRPLRERGTLAGVESPATLMYRGELLGHLIVWTQDDRVAEARAALDAIAPWASAALGTARNLGHLRHERAQYAALHAERDGLADTLEDVLTLHPGAVYVFGSDGSVEAKSREAKQALARDPAGVLRALRRLRLPGVTTDTHYETIALRDGGHVHRLIVIERSAVRDVEHAIVQAGRAWSLTPRQLEVVRLLVRGLSNKEIADALTCAEVTVEFHLTEIYKRADVHGRHALTAAVLKHR